MVRSSSLSLSKRVSCNFIVDENLKYLRISQYAATSIENAAYIIGGYTETHQPVGTIAKYENNEWSNLDDLLEPRYGHAVITRTPYETMVVGGPGE